MEQSRAFRITHLHFRLFVHWQVILLLIVSVTMVKAQTGDSSRTGSAQIDSTRKQTFAGTNSLFTQDIHRERTLDGAISGGIGFYNQQHTSTSQATANLDFNAQTSILDLIAGFHWGFSSPSTKSVSIGLRFPISQSDISASGVFADAAFLFIDNGHDTNGFQTGLRAALVGRNGPAHLEYRLAAEMRRVPFGNNTLEGWAGIEVGFFTNLLHEEVHELTRKDSLRLALRYIATTDEIQGLDNTSSDASLDEWLDRFWRVRDSVTGTPANAMRTEYERRIAYVNKEFGTARHVGVSTDQGRVILLYGDPDQVEAVPSIVINTRRYMLWTFANRIKGYHSAMFLFETDQSPVNTNVFASHGTYRQIYSNVLGEATEGIPYDLPVTLRNYIQSFGS